MAIQFDADGNIVFNDPVANACPTDPDEANQCEGCQ